MSNLVWVILGIVVVFVIVTYVIWRVSKGIKIIKYIPSILSLIFSAYFFYLAKYVRVHEGFKDLANFVYSMFLFTGFVSSTITALILDLMGKTRRG